MSAVVEIDRITVRFGKVTAVRDLSLEVRPGEILGLIGPNGSGKTTTIRSITGLQLCDEGTVRICGSDVSSDPLAARRHLAWVPDMYGVYEHLTVVETLRFFAGLSELETSETERRLPGLLERFSLAALRDTMASTLSRGVRQRLMMAQMQLRAPRLLLLDEPAGGLDPRARRLLFEWLRESAAAGVAVIISSHVLTELTEVCTSVAVLEAGRLVVAGRVEEVGRRLLPKMELRIELLAGEERAEAILRATLGVVEVKRTDRSILCEVAGTEEDAAEIVRSLAMDESVRVISFAAGHRDLEAIFMAATRGEVT